MDMEFVADLFVLILIVGAVFGGKDKKKAKRERKQAQRAASAAEKRDEALQAAQREATQRAQAKAAERRAAKEAARAQKERAAQTSCAPCEQEDAPLHAHAVTQAQMQAAGEGDDPCHAGGRAPEMDAAQAADALWRSQQDMAYALDEERPIDAMPTTANALLQGVIWSEVLTRPCERAARRRQRMR